MLKKSYYTIVEQMDSDILIYNTKNGIQVIINDEDATLLEDVMILKNNENCNAIKNETIKKFFCVDETVNELDVVMANYYKQMFDPTNLSFIIMPNNMCNFKCMYCYQEHDKRVFTRETMDNFVKAIKDYHETIGIKQFYAEWFGGEPFMTYNMIVEITELLTEYFEDNQIKYHFGATTNGSLLDEKKIDYLLEHNFDYFQITLDGSRDLHNQTRPFLDGDGSWDVICANLVKLHCKSDYNFHVAVRVNYNNDTFEKISELFDFMKNELDNRFTIFFHTIGKWGGKNDDLLEVIDPALEPYTTLMLMDEAVKYGIEPKTNYDFYNPFRKVCYAAMPYHFTLGSDGKLRKCNEEDKEVDSFNIVGTIENGKIEIDIEKWSKFVLPGGHASLSLECTKCVYLPICFSQNCPKTRMLSEGVPCPHDISVMSEVVMNKYKFRKKIMENSLMHQNKGE